MSAYRSADLTSAEINVLTELWRGVPLGSEAGVVNGWPRDELAEALASLSARGLASGETITEAGRSLRDEIELATSLGERSLIEAIGDEFDDLIAALDPWSELVSRKLRPPYWWHTWKPS